MKRCLSIVLALLSAACLGSCARSSHLDPTTESEAAQAPASPLAAEKVEQELDWLEMLPPDELKALEAGDVPAVQHSGNNAMEQFGTFRTVDSVLNRPIRLPGYIVPLESEADGKLREFLFVPYYGACIHVPPPPPNQIVHVRLPHAVPMPDMYSPFFLAGQLVAERTDDALAGSAYTIREARLRPYEP